MARTKRSSGSSRNFRGSGDLIEPADPDVRDVLGSGFVIPVGGAEEKVGDIMILRRFVALCGGPSARIAIIPTASELTDTGAKYAALFTSLGAAATAVLPITDRSHAMDPSHVGPLDEVDGIFLTGGNQLRLSTLIGGTDVARAIRRRNAAGVHVAGTSAGAAFLCEHMIAFGREGASPRAKIVTLAPGLGLTNRVIIDQHFRQRDRLGRLLAAISFNPFTVGLGLDEDTAAFIGADEVIEVDGSGAVTIVDPSQVEHSSMGSAKPGEPVSMLGVRMHILVRGGTFDLKTRSATPATAEHDPD